ncbi:GNAT family N-acetyltransferase, partial [Streptomyces sp. Act-28]
MSAYGIREALSDEDRAAAFAVRREVFVVEQGVAEEIEYDAHDATAVHVLAVRTADGVALGTGRLLYGPAAAERTGGEEGVGAL